MERLTKINVLAFCNTAREVIQLLRTDIIQIVKHEEGSSLLWGCMSSSGMASIHIIKNSKRKFKEKMAMSGPCVFQQDQEP